MQGLPNNTDVEYRPDASRIKKMNAGLSQTVFRI
jgi:hypothetical protein